jgi:hypothetical protein
MELSTVYQNDNGKSMIVNRDGVPANVKFATPDSEADSDPGKFGSTLKPRSDIEASPRQRDLPLLPPDEQRHSPMSLGVQRFKDGALRQQQFAMEGERQESDEFQRR